MMCLQQKRQRCSRDGLVGAMQELPAVQAEFQQMQELPAVQAEFQQMEELPAVQAEFQQMKMMMIRRWTSGIQSGLG